jgi:hypothetical protein
MIARYLFVLDLRASIGWLHTIRTASRDDSLYLSHKSISAASDPKDKPVFSCQIRICDSADSADHLNECMQNRIGDTVWHLSVIEKINRALSRHDTLVIVPLVTIIGMVELL